MLLTRETLLRIIDAHLGDRAPATVSKEAGLPHNAIASLRQGKVPSIERASRILSQLGLELRVGPEGDLIDRVALKHAVRAFRDPDYEFELRRGSLESAVEMFAAMYEYRASRTCPWVAAQPNRQDIVAAYGILESAQERPYHKGDEQAQIGAAENRFTHLDDTVTPKIGPPWDERMTESDEGSESAAPGSAESDSAD